MKTVFKLLAVLAGLGAALLFLVRPRGARYVELYHGDEDDEF